MAVLSVTFLFVPSRSFFLVIAVIWASRMRHRTAGPSATGAGFGYGGGAVIGH